jgi:hypothetical protein
LTEDEFTEFISHRELDTEKMEDTGRHSEVVRESIMEQLMQAREEDMMREF